MSSQLPSLSVAKMSSHWWWTVISASQFKQFKLNVSGTGVKTSGAGEGMSLGKGEKGAGEFSGNGELLSTSFSGDSTSSSSIRISSLILCAKGGGFEGDGSLGESGKGRFFALWVLTGKAWTDGEACTEAGAACVGESFLGGRREVAAKVAGCLTELLHCFDEAFFCLVTASDPWGKRPLGKRGRMGRWGVETGDTWVGGGTTVEAGGSWNVRLNLAWPPGSASSWKLAERPCLQKLVTCENWCWAKAWAVGDQGAWGGIVDDQPRVQGPLAASTQTGRLSLRTLRGGHSTRPFCKPLKKCYQAM